MKKFKIYSTAVFYIMISLLSINIILTIISYFTIFSPTTIKVLKLIAIIISMIIGGIYIGKKSTKKRYLEGIKLGVVFSLVLFILAFLGLDKNFEISRVIYYLILTLSSMIGSMIGLKKTSQ